MREIPVRDKELLQEFFAQRKRLAWRFNADFLLVSHLGFAGIIDGKQLPLDRCCKMKKKK